PRNDRTHVPVDASIEFRFNMAVDPDTVGERLTVRRVTLLGELLPQYVDGEIVVDGAIVSFRPAEWLAFDDRFVATLDEGVLSVGGGRGTAESTTIRFSTVPLPRILDTFPRDGDRNAPSHTSFSIEFNTAIDPDTVLANITMEPALPDDVDGWYSGWSNRYTFDFGALPSHDYTVHIGPDIADRYGNTTGQSITVEFRTAALSPAAWLQLPGHIGTFSSYTPALLVAAHRNVSRLELDLYRLPLEEAFELLDDWYDYKSTRSLRIRSWELSVEAPLDETVYTPISLLEGGGPLDPGLYLVDLDSREVEYGWYRPRHLVVVSPLNITLKADERRTLAWVTDLQTGEPAMNVVLAAYDGDGELVAESVTNADGLAVLPGTDAYGWRGMFVVARDPFALASSEWSPGIGPWDFGYGSSSLVDVRSHLDTDRPIYRPGQTVHFRGVVRNEFDASYSLRSLSEVAVSVRDAQWDLVYEGVLDVDELGSFTGSFDLAAGAALGDYVLAADLPGAGARHRFTVAAYRPPEFSVTVSPSADEISAGDAAQATVDVAYFFGGAVANADVTWTVFTEPFWFAPAGFEQYSFSDVDDPWICWSCWWWGPPSRRESLASGTGTTGADGQLSIPLPETLTEEAVRDDEGELRGSQRLTVEATAYGADGQVLSGRTEMIVHRGAFYVGIAPNVTIGTAGREMSADVVVVDWRGLRQPHVELTYTVQRRLWENVFVEREDGSGRWEWTTVDTEVASGSTTSDELGEATVAFTPEEGGSYRIAVGAVDPHGRSVRSSVFVWVSGPERVSWRRENHDRITLIADKPSYALGDTARILIPSPYEGRHWALITVERGTILRHEVVRLDSTSTVYELEIDVDHVPNIYVSAVLVQGSDAAFAQDGRAIASHKVGYASLAVDTSTRRLTIDLTPSTENPGPGDDVTYTLVATDSAGNPARASFAVDIVDKAVLTLSPRPADALHTAYYSPRGLGVDTAGGLAVSIERLLVEQLEMMGALAEDEDLYLLGDAVNAVPASAEAGALRESAETAAAEGVPEGVEVREQFEDTAFWSGRLVTDASGQATFTVTLPDNLTTWVVRAAGVTAETRVGEATTELLVTKPLLVRPITPRFFVVDDRVQIAALVNNNTESARDVDVTLSADGVVLAGDQTKRVTVAAGGEARVTWWATAQDVPAVDLTVAAVSGALTDAARPRLTTGPDGTLLVYRYTTPEVVGTAGQLSESGFRSERLVLPASIDDRRGSFTVRLDASLAVALREGLDYLEHFEYECTEQLVSRFLPNLLNYRALLLLGVDQPELREKLETLVSVALERLYPRQRDDGGWGWWRGGRSSTFLTAYVVFAMHVAASLDFEVRREAIDDGLAFLRDALLDREDLDGPFAGNAQAWLLYVLTIADDDVPAAHVGALYDARDHLGHYGRALLILTLNFLNPADPRIDTIISDLENDVILSATGAHWEESTYSWWAM
ncbi:MAG: Ig-like domain-containing protein, partial [Candidatus Bipolaricaulota bacterium]